MNNLRRYCFKWNNQGLILNRKLNMIKRAIFYLIYLFIVINCVIYAQETNAQKDKYQSKNGYSTWQSSRGYTLSLQKRTTKDVGNVKWLRFVYLDGNLITGGITNNGLLSGSYIPGVPNISWPKGPKSVSEIFGAVFYVAGQVVDTKGDTIAIVSDSYRRGNIEESPDQSHWFEWEPLPGYFNEHEPNSTDWQVGGISEDVGIDGVPNTHDFGEGDGVLQPQEDFNHNGILDTSMINQVGWFALSTRRQTWPQYWPIGSYPGDTRHPGDTNPKDDAREGRWNGAYGAYVRADQESYYIMDDRENDQYDYYPFSDSTSRLPWPKGRRGLGITVEARSYAWAAPLAEDILICIYEVTNYGKFLPKNIVGMLIDPDMGGDLHGDDASFDTKLDITYAWNKIGYTNDGLPIGYFGFAYLESPGNSHNGIDDDQDGMVDESQNNHIDDNHDWVPYTDLNHDGKWDSTKVNGVWEMEPLNDDVGSDGLGPLDDNYNGPDLNGSQGNGIPDEGEPNFDLTDNTESDQVGLTSFYLKDVDNEMQHDQRYWDIEIKPGTFTVRPGFQRDICFSYGCGYIPLYTGATQKFAIGLIFGNTEDQIIRNKRTIQVIYNHNYNFAQPPRKPTLTAIALDHKVILKWDNRAENSNDPIYGHDFECYYIYKSTDPTFSDIKTITDAFGNPFLFKPLAIYDIKDGLTGINPVAIGSELGPQYSLGISYNMGTDSGLRHDYVDTAVTNGRTYYYAVVSVDKGYEPSFYPKWSDKQNLLTISPTACSANITTDLLGRPITTDKNTAIVTPEENPAGYIKPSVNSKGVLHISGDGTGSVKIKIFDEKEIIPNTKYKIHFFDDGSFEKRFGVNFTGVTDSMIFINETTNDTLSKVSDPDHNDYLGDADYQGFKVQISNDTIVSFDSVKSGWVKGNSTLEAFPEISLPGTPVPRDYEIKIMYPGVDTAVNRIITNFQIWDITNPDSSFKVRYRYDEDIHKPNDRKGLLTNGDRLTFYGGSGYVRTWNFEFNYPTNLDSSKFVLPQKGDLYKIVTYKPFDRNDIFQFTMIGNAISKVKEKVELNNIYTVPDPYLAVSTLERKVINNQEGRGDRRIDFVNLPNRCTISIFTTSGTLVRTLEHNTTNGNTRESWDLRSSDGLEVASGIYFYVVQVPGIGKKIGRLAIIK